MKFILQRNTAQVEAKYHYLQEGEAFGSFDAGPIEDATLTVIGRGVYDSIYDIGDAFSHKFTEQEKEKRKFEYKLREIYTDLALPPLSFRIGRQQVVWGETDNFRALDQLRAGRVMAAPVRDCLRSGSHRRLQPAFGGLPVFQSPDFALDPRFLLGEIL